MSEVYLSTRLDVGGRSTAIGFVPLIVNRVTSTPRDVDSNFLLATSYQFTENVNFHQCLSLFPETSSSVHLLTHHVKNIRISQTSSLVYPIRDIVQLFQYTAPSFETRSHMNTICCSCHTFLTIWRGLPRTIPSSNHRTRNFLQDARKTICGVWFASCHSCSSSSKDLVNVYCRPSSGTLQSRTSVLSSRFYFPHPDFTL